MMPQSANRCFPEPRNLQYGLPRKNHLRILDWIETEGRDLEQYTLEQQHALAILIPLLLCGEQSAQLVFNAEIQRLGSTASNSVKVLKEVDQDEYYHDVALQHVQGLLPSSAEQHQVQRHARRFYTSLARVDNLSEHFVRIAILDACVTQIMHAVEHGTLGMTHPFARLCGLIKKDEAKHVYVSRQHAISLGASKQNFTNQQQQITLKLFQLLNRFQTTFHLLGVDLECVFSRLEAKWQ